MIAYPKTSRGLLKWFFVLLVVVATAFIIYVVVKVSQPAATAAESQLYTVEMGATGKSIARDLESQGLINSSYFFELYLYFEGSAEKIQAGSYELSSAMSIRDIVARLVKGDAIFDAVTVRVIEGWNLNDIAAELRKQGIVTEDEFFEVAGAPRVGGADDFSDTFEFLSVLPQTASLEGFLYPDTYFFDRDVDVEMITEKFLTNFEKKILPLAKNIEESNRDLFEIITLASIVEREVGRNLTKLDQIQLDQLQTEREIVAGIFENRLEIDMPLESDATITYITGRKDAQATLAETKIDSPYNTYQNRGLPPGPIANPSVSSIKAVLDPADTDYLFFLTDSEGRAHYAETLEGHIENRNRYLDNN